ncbi:MAG: AAA family ATPase [Sphingobacteriia bacterium]|nr:AAA family ATPase [Sphingobacteriia bacterium]NCC40999.1 AAA family ATPase [Gammaproteobacteria bacterium]
MPRSLREIEDLLPELESVAADTLEDQDLDFKEWITRSREQAVDQVVEMAVCMANSGGGTVVFGVRDRVAGRNKVLLGVPLEIDTNLLVKAVYDRTDPKLTPAFEDLAIPEGTGRLLVMQVHGGLPPYNDSQGRAKVRIGKDCQPMTGSLRRRILVETGETDFTAGQIDSRPAELLSDAAMEQLRDVARRENAPEDLLRLSETDLLTALEVLRDGRLTLAGLFLAGHADALRRHLPKYVWTHARMRSDTDPSDRMDGNDALPVALSRVLDRIMADNPISTLELGLFHHEYRAYPEIALREALMNALCHQDFRLGGPLLISQYPDRIEIANAGGFIGGVSPDNILRHRPVPRNPLLVNALVRLRLVNRMNLGVRRMFQAMLIEGKTPPTLVEEGESVLVRFRKQPISAPVRLFVADEGKAGRILSVEQLLVLHYLLAHPELNIATAAPLCQRTEPETRDLLNEMETGLGYLERGGTGGRGTYWTLRPHLHQRLAGPGYPERDRRIAWEAAKTRILSVLQERARCAGSGLSNQEIRQITHYDRNQVVRLMQELREENPQIRLDGGGRSAAYRIEMQQK